MECNKDEASRAKEIAERKVLSKDFSGAKKFALKAQNLNPGLEGIDQMLAALSVHIAAESKLNGGEGNVYGILGVNPKADDESIRKQYRKLALMLHPDKNKSVGAEAAFKHVSEAWSLVSDKNKKIEYDNRHANAFRAVCADPSSSHQSAQNGFHNFAKNAAAAAAAAAASSRARPPKGNVTKKNPSSGKQDKGTFWTVCYRCKMQYEYMRMYLNHNLLCPNCQEAFFAVETTAPSKGSKKSSHAPRSSSGAQNVGSSAKRNDFQWAPFSKTGGHPSAVQAANVVQQAYQKVKRERQAAQAATKRAEALRRKNRSSKRPRETLSAGEFNAYKRKKGMEDFSTIRARTAAEVKWGNSDKEAFHNDVKQLLMEKAKKDIREKLSQPTELLSIKRKNEEIHGLESDAREHHDTAESKVLLHECSSRAFDNCLELDVPESDFHNFDIDRIESCFEPNQVWAAYDDSDGMSRYYAMILKVISLNPFRARISWLKSSNDDIGNSGVPTTFGYFRRGRNEIRNSINCFSHQVKWTKVSGGGDVFRIFPQKGEVWALYRNWSPQWDEFTDDGVIRKYDLVEVLEDFNEQGGSLVVAPLVKVAGFKSVFYKHLDPKEMKKIHREEMFRFSHQISSYLLTGEEGPTAPKGYLELDPAAMPAELLEVIQVTEEIECSGLDGNKEENTSDATEVIILDS